MMLTCHYGRLPHFRLENSTYFVTWRQTKEQPDFSDLEKSIMASALWWGDDVRYRLHAYVVMNDHVHVLAEPLADWPMEGLVQSWKSFTAHRFQRRPGKIWQREYFDRIVRNADEYCEKRNYILANPKKRWPDREGYPWAWAIGLPCPDAP